MITFDVWVPSLTTSSLCKKLRRTPTLDPCEAPEPQELHVTRNNGVHQRQPRINDPTVVRVRLNDIGHLRWRTTFARFSTWGEPTRHSRSLPQLQCAF